MGPALSLFLLFLATTGHAALFADPSLLTKTQYDYVIVGGGNAGCVVAARLTENPNINVLVIEAGKNNADVPLTDVPFAAPALLADTSIYFEYTTTPQPGLNNQVLAIERGKILGGSSSVNFHVYARGSREQYDRYAHLADDSGWSWDSLLPYIKKYEGFTAPVDGHNTKGQFNPSVHGFKGPLKTTLPNFPTPVDSRIFAITQSNPHEFPFNADINSGNQLGIGWMQTTTGNGVRSSAVNAYINPALQRPNLDILVNTQVTKLINIVRQEGDVTNITTAHRTKPDLRQVEFATSPTSPRKTVRALKEVVLSAGSIGTPQLLLLSGVGNAQNLTSLGIPVQVNLPGVGQNLQDHAFLSNQWTVNNPAATLDNFLRDPTLQGQAFQQWQTNHTGQFSDGVTNFYGWLRAPASVLKGFTDPTPGPNTAHYELLPTDFFISFKDSEPATGSFVSLVTALVTPSSVGSMWLKTTNPFDFPAIDPAYMTHPLDVKIMTDALRKALDFYASPSFKDLAPQPAGDLAGLTTDDQLAAYIRSGVTSGLHPVGTAKMGRSSDPMAVVDSHLRLKGVTGVRIVDASVLPFVPSAHLQAPVYVFAERAADLIKHSEE